MKGVRNQMRQVAGAEWRQADLLNRSAGLTDSRELPRQWMRRADLIVSIRADHQQVRQIFLDQQILQKIECRRVQPLQIVEKQAQGMLSARENAEEPPECKVRANFRLLRRQRGNGWLFSYD